MRRGVRGIEPAYYIEFGSGTSIYYSIERYCYFFLLVGRRRSVCFDFNRIVINTCKISGERTIIDNKKLFFFERDKIDIESSTFLTTNSNFSIYAEKKCGRKLLWQRKFDR